jgi:hypothetical protein
VSPDGFLLAALATPGILYSGGASDAA